MSYDCFGRAFLVTVKPRAPSRTLDANEGNNPAMFVSKFTEGKSGSHRSGGWDGTVSLRIPSSTTNPLTATALIYALGAGITAGAGTRLVLQLLLDVGWL